MLRKHNTLSAALSARGRRAVSETAPVSAAQLELAGLTKSFGPAGRAPTVDGIDLAVQAGSLTALLGPSGCGKTTTLRLIAGLLTPSAGDVLIGGRSVLGVAPERRPVGLVLQRPLLFAHLSVGDNVAFGLRMHGVGRSERRDSVLRMLDRVHLREYADRRVDELSGGQAQRVALARALVVAPAVLLLDEPLSQLDPSLREQMRDLIRELHRATGLTTVFVTHDQQEAVDVADRVALLLDGRLEQVAAPGDFYRRPATLAVARFFGARNTLPGVVRAGTFLASPLAIPVAAADGPGVLVIRPEAVLLVPEGTAGALPGTVLEARQLGTRVELRVRLTASEDLRLQVSVQSDVELRPGDSAHMLLPAAACTIVPPDPIPVSTALDQQR